MDTKSQRDIARKLKILNYALDHKNVAKTCRHFSIDRATFYRWKTAYLLKGELGLIDSRPAQRIQHYVCQKSLKRKLSICAPLTILAHLKFLGI